MLTFHYSISDYKSIDIKDKHIEIMTGSKNDTQLLKELSSEIFSQYHGHYHHNPFLDSELCNELYSDWAGNLVTKKTMADVVFICKVNGRAAGFSSLKINRKGIAIAGLLGVMPTYRKMGIGKWLHIKRFEWCLLQGIDRIHVETGINNKPYIHLLNHIGYTYHSANHIFHWIDNRHRSKAIFNTRK